MKTLKSFLIAAFLLFAFSATSQEWTLHTDNNLYNDNNLPNEFVKIGQDAGAGAPTNLLHCARNMTGPQIIIENLGGLGGAGFTMKDNAGVGGEWKFKAITGGGFKIRDQASSMDVIVIKKGAAANCIYIAAGGGIGIGTTTIPGTYKMAIDGKVIVEGLDVQLSGSWPDYVFKEDYKLRSIPELEAFINENGHLPDVPSAEEMENGVLDLEKMNTLLLQKVEELTLYVIELKKEVDALKK